MIDILMAHSIARRVGKPPFFFSRFNFERMQALGNTHYCFACLAGSGYRPDKNGNPTNIAPEDLRAVRNHTDEHAPYVVGDADKYSDVWSWLEAKITPDFPYLVAVPSLP